MRSFVTAYARLYGEPGHTTIRESFFVFTQRDLDIHIDHEQAKGRSNRSSGRRLERDLTHAHLDALSLLLGTNLFDQTHGY